MSRHDPQDEYWMNVALTLAGEGIGMTRPNPPVGAVVVKNGRAIGAGFHPAAGKPHAEVFALDDAGKAAMGATLYVTLEPCTTQGRTPPCTDAIIRSGVTHVVYGCDDPNPRHAGAAFALLRRHGITVTRNVLQTECRRLIAPFAMRLLERRPYVTVKLACSLDGRIADRNGCSKWITGPDARGLVQEMRRGADAIMVGAGTVRSDNPSLLPRPAWGRKPYRVVISSSGILPRRARLFTDEHAGRTLVFAPQSKADTLRRSIGSRGVQVHAVRSGPNGLYLHAVMRTLADLGIMHVLCEGGGALTASLTKRNLVDELAMFYAPIVLGADARPSLGGASGWRLKDAAGFVIRETSAIGLDVLVRAERKREQER